MSPSIYPVSLFLIFLVGAVGFPRPASADEDESSRPYPVDVTSRTLSNSAELGRLQMPGRILFKEGFDELDTLDRFFNLRGKERGALEITTDSSDAHSGSGSLQLHTVDNEDRASGASASYWLNEGVDTLYFRRYIRFAEDYDQGNLHHVGGSLAAVAGDDSAPARKVACIALTKKPSSNTASRRARSPCEP